MENSLLKDDKLQFGATTFFAKEHKGDCCGSNGLPLTPNSIVIIGKAQKLKTLHHPNLCSYLDIIRGKHERTIVVSQYSGEPLLNQIEKNHFEIEQIKQIAFEILNALNYLHSRKILHRNLSSENILLQTDGTIKLFNYGLYDMTDGGKLVTFPIMQLLYSPPEVYLNHFDPKSDIWSFAIIITELLLKKRLWCTLNLNQKIRKILSLVNCNTSILEKIYREHDLYEQYQNLDEDLKAILESCLQVNPKKRPNGNELLERTFFKNCSNSKDGTHKDKTFQVFTIHELYHWWQLAGGDVYQELKKQGLIRSSPPILSLPSLVLNDGAILGQERNPATLYDTRVVRISLDGLYQRFEHIPFESYHPLLLCKSKIIQRAEPEPYDASSLPLVIRERDPEYQFHRVILFRRLLHGYPFTRDLIIKESTKDIPPLLRGEVWVALLNIEGDVQRSYKMIDKETLTSTDRQIEVDIPRCHQYNELLSSPEGHRKLKRILKAWVSRNTQYVYWQGLDSLTAPFLYLNFNDEALAFACISAFVIKYLHNFFLKDNSMVIQEYLAKFSQLIAFHDPKLANHLFDINFYPELFAIPWFLTVFSHVFPLYKILHLWDYLLLGDASFPLHIGLSVLTQLRDRLLNSGFNECILLFSDLPEVDIEKCLRCSMETFKSTPKSVTTREHQNETIYPKNELDIRGVTLKELNNERCPRISIADMTDLIQRNVDGILIIDIRNPIQFNRCSVVGAINVPFSSVTFSDQNLANIRLHGETIQNSGDKIVIIVGAEDTDLENFPKYLLKCGVSKLCVLHGGFDVIVKHAPNILTNGLFQ